MEGGRGSEAGWPRVHPHAMISMALRAGIAPASHAQGRGAGPQGHSGRGTCWTVDRWRARGRARERPSQGGALWAMVRAEVQSAHAPWCTPTGPWVLRSLMKGFIRAREVERATWIEVFDAQDSLAFSAVMRRMVGWEGDQIGGSQRRAPAHGDAAGGWDVAVAAERDALENACPRGRDGSNAHPRRRQHHG